MKSMSTLRSFLLKNDTVFLLWEKAEAKLLKDKNIPLGMRVRKGIRFTQALLMGRMYLRSCDVLGARCRVRGKPFVENAGRLEIGDDFNFVSYCVQSHMVVGPGAVLRIGNDVSINFGAALSAQESVSIGSRVRMGPYVMILDSDYHGANQRDEKPTTPIVIEDDVWLAGRVSVLRGSHIGKGSVITTGSVVSGHIPAGVIAGGVPARVIRSLNPTEESVLAPKKSLYGVLDIEKDVVSIACRVFGEASLLLSSSPESVPSWNSLGQLKYILELENHFGTSFETHEVASMRTLGDVVDVLKNKFFCAQTAHAQILHTAYQYPEHRALNVSGKAVSYRGFVDLMWSCASFLHHKGVRKGDKVLVCVKHKADYVVCMYGVMALGAVAVPMHEDVSQETLKHVLHQVNPACALYDQNPVEGVLCLKSSEALSCAVLEEVKNVVVEEKDMALIMFTSGTSGEKKGVCLSHQNICQSADTIVECMGMDASMVEYVCVPLTHSFGFGRVRALFACGGTLVADNGVFSPLAVVEGVEKNKCNALSCVPAQVGFLSSKQKWIETLGKHVRVVEMGSAFMSEKAKKNLQEMWPDTRIFMHYGLTEASRSVFLNFCKDETKLSSVGKPPKGVHVRVMDEKGDICAPYVVGEIQIEGNHVMLGYLHGVRHESGFFSTGDEGFLDEEGYVYFVGRKDDTINSAGVKIAPLFIEQSVQKHFPKLVCCVVGIKASEDYMGEIPCLVLQQEQAEHVSDKEIFAMISKEVEKSHMPQKTVRVPLIPVTENGKIKRKEMKKILEEKAGVQ
jgi:long-chain acyl-CoA synthetase